jgi:hypothetical protein
MDINYNGVAEWILIIMEFRVGIHAVKLSDTPDN